MKSNISISQGRTVCMKPKQNGLEKKEKKENKKKWFYNLAFAYHRMIEDSQQKKLQFWIDYAKKAIQIKEQQKHSITQTKKTNESLNQKRRQRRKQKIFQTPQRQSSRIRSRDKKQVQINNSKQYEFNKKICDILLTPTNTQKMHQSYQSQSIARVNHQSCQTQSIVRINHQSYQTQSIARVNNQSCQTQSIVRVNQQKEIGQLQIEQVKQFNQIQQVAGVEVQQADKISMQPWHLTLTEKTYLMAQFLIDNCLLYYRNMRNMKSVSHQKIICYLQQSQRLYFNAAMLKKLTLLNPSLYNVLEESGEFFIVGKNLSRNNIETRTKIMMNKLLLKRGKIQHPES